MSMAVSQPLCIVVASHRPACMEALGERLCAIRECEPMVEVCVVTDYDPAALRERYPAIGWVEVRDRSISRKRNAALSRTAASLVGFTDDDCLPAMDWVRCARAFLQAHPACCAVEGKTTIDAPVSRAESLREYQRLEQPGYRTNNIVYRAAALRRAGGFDERFSVQREDLDLALTLVEQGETIGWCESMHVRHRYREHEPWDLLKNCWNRRFDPLLYRKHPRGYRRMVGSPLPLSLRCLGGVEVLGVVVVLARPLLWPGAAVVVLGALLGAVVRRRGGWHPGGLVREVGVMSVAPWVIVAALMWGSLRYRSLLVW